MARLLDETAGYLVDTVGLDSRGFLGVLRGTSQVSEEDAWLVNAVYSHIHSVGYSMGDLVSALLGVSTRRDRVQDLGSRFKDYVSGRVSASLPVGCDSINLGISDGSLVSFLGLSDFSVGSLYTGSGSVLVLRFDTLTTKDVQGLDLTPFSGALKSVGIQLRNRYALYVLILLKLVWLASCGLPFSVYAQLTLPLDFCNFLFESEVYTSLGALSMVSGQGVTSDLFELYKFKGGTVSTLWALTPSDGVLESFGVDMLDFPDVGSEPIVSSRSFGVVSTLSLKDWVFSHGTGTSEPSPELFYLVLPDREFAWPSGILLTSERTSIPVTRASLLRVLVLFSVCRVLDTVPDSVQFRAPDTSVQGFTSWVADCIVFALFNQYNTVVSVGGNPLFPYDLGTVLGQVSDPVLMGSVSVDGSECNVDLLNLLSVYLPQCSEEGRVFFDFCSQWLMRTLQDSVELRGSVGYSHGVSAWDSSFYQLRSVLSFSRKEKSEYNAALWGLTKRIRDGLSVYGILSI